jgi:hypothetical protein
VVRGNCPLTTQPSGKKAKKPTKKWVLIGLKKVPSNNRKMLRDLQNPHQKASKHTNVLIDQWNTNKPMTISLPFFPPFFSLYFLHFAIF